MSQLLTGSPHSSATGSARLLGYAGLLPFFLSASALWLTTGQAQALALKALLAYGAVILSFVGALHWSQGMTDHTGENTGRLMFSVLPALLAWVALLVPAASGISLLIAGFALVCWYDHRHWAHSPWFLRLRRELTAGVVLLLILALIPVASAL